MYDFKNLYIVTDKLKSCLENNFRLVYIIQKVQKQDKGLDSKSEENHLHFFNIPKDKISIFKKITSADSLSTVKKEIQNRYDDFIDSFGSYFDRVENQLNETNIESFEIILKTLKNRNRKLTSKIKRFKIENDWNIKKLQEEFFFSISKILEDIIDSIISPIIVGLKENNSYETLLKDLNNFLASLGIYTKTFEVGYRLKEEDWDFIKPQDCENCDTTDLDKKDVIKDILTYQYLTNEIDIISSGKINVWRIKHNG